MRAAFVWDDVFVRAWAATGRLGDIRRAIAVLTAGDTLHVNWLDPWTWSDFLQLLEETAPA
jgi:hypothetical protein